MGVTKILYVGDMLILCFYGFDCDYPEELHGGDRTEQIGRGTGGGDGFKITICPAGGLDVILISSRNGTPGEQNVGAAITDADLGFIQSKANLRGFHQN